MRRHEAPPEVSWCTVAIVAIIVALVLTGVVLTLLAYIFNAPPEPEPALRIAPLIDPAHPAPTTRPLDALLTGQVMWA